jgi:hypothetical protein
MTGPEHYREAERILDGVAPMIDRLRISGVGETVGFAAAEVATTAAHGHALLALAAATAASVASTADRQTWRSVIGEGGAA